VKNEDNMKLSHTERWILANQYLILEALYPDQEESFSWRREALEKGFETEYTQMSEHIYDTPDIMSTAECEKVLAILDMYRALKFSYRDMPEKSGIEESWLSFPGFDGNYEGKQRSYAWYFCNKDGGLFTELERGDHFNSHARMMGIYEEMLDIYDQCTNKFPLSKEEIFRITTPWHRSG
jgi:uncharacterized protein YfbU (UPF0304 family)